MKRSFKIVATSVLALALAGPAAASTLNISFTGTVERTNDGANADVASIGSLGVGDAVSGGFQLDTSTVASAGATTANYVGAVTGFTMTLDGLIYSSATSPDTLSVRNDDMSGSAAPLRDSILVSAFSPNGPSVAGLDPSRIQFALGGTDTSVLSDLSMPSVAQFQALFAADTIAGNLNFLSFDDGSDVRFRVDTLTIAAVPLPAGAPLMLAGLGAFMALRRKQRKAA